MLLIETKYKTTIIVPHNKILRLGVVDVLLCITMKCGETNFYTQINM